MPLTLFLYSFLQLLCFTLFSFLCLQHFLKIRKFKTITTKLPTLYGLPFLGINYKFFPLKRFFYELENRFWQFKGQTFFTWLGTNPFVVTIDPDVLRIVLTSDEFLMKAKSVYSPIEHALPNGLTSSNGDKWRHNRKLMSYSFSSKILKRLMPIFNKGAQKIIEELKTLVDNREHDVFALIKRIIFQMSIETTMGIELKDGDEIDEKVTQGFNFISQEVAREMFFDSFHLGFLVHTPKYNRTIKFMRDYAANLINLEYAARKSSPESTRMEDTEMKLHEIFLQQAISYYERDLFDFDDVISQTHTVIAGTFDTVTTTIYSLIVLLAMHPNIQEKLYVEISEAISTTDPNISYEQIKQITYMDMVIDEALRLMPSIPLIGRQTNRDVKIREDLTLPGNMQVLIPIFTLHRCKEIWGPNANVFDPDNFLPERVRQRHSYAYIPFSRGPRNCLGLRYAHVAVRVLLLTLVRNYKFSTSFKYEDLIFLCNVSLRYEVEPKIKIEWRGP